MLVLSRKAGEALVIDEKYRVIIQSIRGSRVRVAIDAPKEVKVRREEVAPREPIDSLSKID